MQNNLDDLIDKITSHSLFLRLKDVIEHSEGWHDHEPVFDHLVKTEGIAREQVKGDFITNSEAKTAFENWMDEEIDGMKKRGLSVLIALIHDCGKILSLKENGKVNTLITTNEGQTSCPGHEYYGGTIVAPAILKDLNLNSEIIDYTCNVIIQHDAFGSGYFLNKENWSQERLINDVKARANGYYKESLFNMYCDGFTSPAFVEGRKKIERIFNDPALYVPREYFIP